MPTQFVQGMNCKSNQTWRTKLTLYPIPTITISINMTEIVLEMIKIWVVIMEVCQVLLKLLFCEVLLCSSKFYSNENHSQDSIITHLIFILQRNHPTSARHHQRPLQTAPTTTCRIAISPTLHHWTSRTPHQYQPIPTWPGTHRHHHCPRMAHCCATRGRQCHRQMSCTTPTRTRRSCRRRRSRRNASSLVSVIITVLMNRKDILSETRRTFCMCFKVGDDDDCVQKLLCLMLLLRLN